MAPEMLANARGRCPSNWTSHLVAIEEFELERGEGGPEPHRHKLRLFAHLFGALVAEHGGLAATQAVEGDEICEDVCRSEEDEARHESVSQSLPHS